MKNAAPNPQPTPAAPAPSPSQNLQLLTLLPSAVAFTLPSANSLPISFPPVRLARAFCVPLYQQNCTFLI